MPAVLTMGFSPAASVATWRLASTGHFDCYIYWPASVLQLTSDVFGNESYRPKQLDFARPPRDGFSIVLLVIPSIRDVQRMCKRLQPVITKNTLILVDVSGGIAPLQRLVRAALPKSSVAGIIFDIDAELTSASKDGWSVTHRRSADFGAIVEPPSSSSAQKVLQSLEVAMTIGGIRTEHPKTQQAFGAIQWMRTIQLVAFELVGIVLELPTPEEVVTSVVAQPLLEGVIAELTQVAHAANVKGLPSKQQIISRAGKLTRRAPAGYPYQGATRAFYDFDRGVPLALDFYLLFPILLADELPKGQSTPYLESLFAFLTHLCDLSLGNKKTKILGRIADQPKSVPQEFDSEELKGLRIKVSNYERQADKFNETERKLQQAEARIRESSSDRAREIRQHNEEKQSEMDRIRLELEQRQAEWQQSVDERERELQRREQEIKDDRGQTQNVNPAHIARERELVSREQQLLNREQQLLEQERTLKLKTESFELNRSNVSPTPSGPVGVPSGPPSGPPNGPPNGPSSVPSGLFNGQHPVNGHLRNQAQYTNGYGHWAPGYGPPQGPALGPALGPVVGSPHGPPAHGLAQGPPLGPPQGPPSAPVPAPMTTTMGPPLGAAQSRRSMATLAPRSSQNLPATSRRRLSQQQDVDMMSVTSRRKQSAPNAFGSSTSLSQRLQLDSIANSVSDPYHSVGRAQRASADATLSADAYTVPSKHVHGPSYSRMGSNGILRPPSVAESRRQSIKAQGAPSIVSTTGPRPRLPMPLMDTGDFSNFTLGGKEQGGSGSSSKSQSTPSYEGTPPTPHGMDQSPFQSHEVKPLGTTS